MSIPRPAVLLVFVALFATLLAANPVVGQDTIQEANPGNLARLIDEAEPGTVIELAPGTYVPQPVRQKTDLTIRAAEPGTALFSSNSFEVGTGLSIANSSNIVIEGIAVDQSKWGIGVLRSSNVTISDVMVSDIGQRGIWIHGDSTNVTVEGSTVQGTGQRPGTRPNGSTFSSIGEGIYVGSGDNPNDRSNNIVITGNTISETTAEAIDVKAGAYSVTISSNVISNVAARTGAIAIHPGTLPGDAGLTTVSGNVVSGVTATDDRGGSGILLSAGSRADANVVFNVENDGLEVREVTGAANQVVFRTNTIFSSGDEDFSVDSNQVNFPDPIRWGNGGVERMDGFPEGWIERGQPTDAMWELIAESQLEVDEQTPNTPSRTAVAPNTEAPTLTTLPPATTVPPTTVPGVAPQLASGETRVPVYDTAWQMLVRATPTQADEYFATLDEFGFTGSWAGIIHHSPATYLHNYADGGQVGRLENGQIILNDGYISHVRSILDAAQRHDQKIGLVAAWQNTYLPGGDTGDDELSNRVEGTLTTENAYAYGRQIAEAFGDHPAVSVWVFGGDAGKNNTEANKAVWREMARALNDAGMTQPIGYHTPTVSFGHLNYEGEPWLDFIAPETGHSQGPTETEQQLRTVVDVFDGVPVWQGESRYFNINFDWQRDGFQNPGLPEVVSDAAAAERAGVGGYVYGDAGRWAWCLFQDGNGDTSPCDADNVAASFGQAERDVIDIFR